MNTMKNAVLFILSVAILAGCSGNSFKKTKGGMPYKIYKGSDTQKVYTGNFMKLNITQKIKDSVYFSTADGLPIYLPVPEESQPYDISELWTSLHVGDSVMAIQMMDTFIKRSPQNIPPEFKKGDRIETFVKVLAVFTSDSAVKADEEKSKTGKLASEIKTIEKFIADKKINAQKTPSGAYVEILEPGTGNLVDSGKYVSVLYTGTSWSGKKFDSNTDTAFHHTEPYSFVAGAGRMIKGFDEALMFLRKGGKAKVYIPSLLAYGANSGSPLIKPYENLIFDLELLDFQDKEPAGAAPAMPPPQR